MPDVKLPIFGLASEINTSEFKLILPDVLLIFKLSLCNVINVLPELPNCNCVYLGILIK